MKQLLILAILFCSLSVRSQDSTNVYRFLRPYKIVTGNIPSDTAKPIISEYKEVMPNAFRITLPALQPAGNNGKGHDIYILPVDNMPVIKPDNSYYSIMPGNVIRPKPKS